MRTRTIVSFIILLLVVAAIWWMLARGGSAPMTQSAPQQVGQASYACNDGKSIGAIFYEGSSTPSTSPDMPPTPGGSVALTLSDGRSMTLPQTISADGARYANADESLVFWTKGNGATVTEGTQPTFTCIVVANDPGGLSQVYENGTAGFSIRYPAGFSVDPSYAYTLLGPGKSIYGTKFQVGTSTAAGTNLGADTYVSVEEIPQLSTCDASHFVAAGTPISTVDDNGTTYSMATTSDAGAGNRYEERVYAMPGTNPCVAIRYFIHYSVFENYPAGSIKEFDENALIGQFDSIRRTLTIDQ